MSDWYVSNGEGAPVGPVSQELVVQGIVAGRVPVSARVCLVGGSEWLSLSAVPDFAAAVRQVAPPPPPPPSGSAVDEGDHAAGDATDAEGAQPADTTALFPNFCKVPIRCPECGKRALRPRILTRDFRCQACSRIFAGQEIEQKAEEAALEAEKRAREHAEQAEEAKQVRAAQEEKERRGTDARCDIAQVILSILVRHIPGEYSSLKKRDPSYAAARRVTESTTVADPVAAAQGITRMVPTDEWVQANQSAVKLFTEAGNLFIPYNEEHREPGCTSRMTLPAEGDPTGARRVFRSAIEQSLSHRHDRGVRPAMQWLERVFETRQAPEPGEYRTESDVSYGERLKSDRAAIDAAVSQYGTPLERTIYTEALKTLGLSCVLAAPPPVAPTTSSEGAVPAVAEASTKARARGRWLMPLVGLAVVGVLAAVVALVTRSSTDSAADARAPAGDAGALSLGSGSPTASSPTAGSSAAPAPASSDAGSKVAASTSARRATAPHDVSIMDPENNPTASVTARVGESVAVTLPAYMGFNRWTYTSVDGALGHAREDVVPRWLGPGTPGKKFTFSMSGVAVGDHVVRFRGDPVSGNDSPPSKAVLTVHVTN
jgi:hypothetical protein